MPVAHRTIMSLSLTLSVLLFAIAATTAIAQPAAPVYLPCSSAGSGCVPGMCCPSLQCVLLPGSRTGTCKKKISPVCTPAGRRCLLGQCCPSLSCVPVPGSRTGICSKKPTCGLIGGRCAKRTQYYTGASFPCCDRDAECFYPDPRGQSGVCKKKKPTCAPVGRSCRKRTPYYTGPSFPCCDRGAECFYPNPKGHSGICRPSIIDTPVCLTSGTTCSVGGAPCCPSLACTAVITGVFPPGGVFPRVCFDENCSTSVCSASQPCCPGYGCSSGRCLAPPAPPPGGI